MAKKDAAPVETPAETPVKTPVETPAETPVETPVVIGRGCFEPGQIAPSDRK